MKTSNYLIALAALTSFTFVSCSDNDFLGTGSGPDGAQQGNGEITFATGTQKITRSETLQGKDAAERLGNQFIVYGWKSDAFAKGATVGAAGTYTYPETVFPYYLLTFQEGSAYSTESNTHSWEYVGNVSVPTAADHTIKEGVNQTIKYWDYTKAQYDFIAWDIKPGSTATYALKEDGVSPWKPKWLEFKAATADEAANIYFADKVTVLKDAVANVDVANKYGGYVQFKFRNLTAKVRMALYETVPGYSVTDVKFYDAATMASPTAKTYLYSVAPASDIPTSGATINVKFSDGTGDAATKIPENQAVADFASITKGTNISFGTLTPDKPREYKEWYESVDEADNVKNKWLGRVSNDPSFATGMYDGKDIGTTGEDLLRNHYTYVFPKAATELCLKVDYRLKSLDGSTDDIIVKGANAIIPATFCEWKANFAYTYLFKISDNTNGSTGTPGTDPAGLYPITFDACVVDMVEGNAQETITELANASVTTYQFGTVVTDYDEYKEKIMSGTTPAYIYVTASNKSGTNPTTGLATLANAAAENTYKAELFLVNNFGDEKITEESVANYKNNNIILTDITTDCFHYADAIPASQTMDNVQKNFSDDGNNVAYFAPKAGYTYAVRFTDNAGKMVYKVIKVDGNLQADRSYTLTTKSSAPAVAENAILADAVTLTEKYTDADAGGTEKAYNVLGAGRLLAATNFTFVDGTTYGKYDAVANVAATTASDIVVTFTPDTDVKDATNMLATSAIEFEGGQNAILDIWPDAPTTPTVVNQIQLKVGTANSTATETFKVDGLNGATGVTLGTVTSGLVPLTVANDARGGKEFSLTYSNKNANQTANQVLAVKTLHVGQWSLGVDKKYVNYSSTDGFKTTSTLTLSLQKSTGAATATDATTIGNINAKNGTETKATIAKVIGQAGKYTVTPTAASNFKISYTNAASIDITTTNIEWTLKKGDDVQAIGTHVGAGDYDLYVTENGADAYVSTLSIDNGTITKTATTGKYKVTVTGSSGATISLNYKGIANYIQTAY